MHSPRSTHLGQEAQQIRRCLRTAAQNTYCTYYAFSPERWCGLILVADTQPTTSIPAASYHQPPPKWLERPLKRARQLRGSPPSHHYHIGKRPAAQTTAQPQTKSRRAFANQTFQSFAKPSPAVPTSWIHVRIVPTTCLTA